ncbi:MAG: hypothetical protein ACRENS_09065 [Candidatus Eiseniibacteriota bacterium]
MNPSESAGSAQLPRTIFSGRYAQFQGGIECGEERWVIEATPDELIARGEQVMTAPHPAPGRLEYRATLTHGWRLTGLETTWRVGERELRALHAADAQRWRARIEYAGHVKEQEGDYPSVCEVDFVTHLFATFLLQRRDFSLGGEHEFPALLIGPPYMAVTPGRMLFRCVEHGTFHSPAGELPARRFVVSRPPESESAGFTLWADDDGVVLESYEGLDPTRPWMTLTAYTRSESARSS